MLPSSSLSKVCGHGHIKKFWLTQNQKESESTSLSAGSAPASASPWRINGAHPTGLELSYGNVSSRAGATAVRPLQISGPVCSNTATATGHASLASCAESLSTLSWSDHYNAQTRPASFSLSSGILKQEHRDDDGATFPCDSPSESRGCRTYVGKAFDGDCTQNLHTEPSVREHWQPEQKKTSQGKCYQMKGSSDSDHLESKFYNREVQERSHMNTFSRIISETLVTSKSFAEDGPAVSDTIGTLPPKDKSSSKQDKVWLSASKGPARIEVFGTIRSHKCSPLRTCLVCGTTETPLWRSGPEGPKSLCNACGIRLKKAKRCSELNERLGSSGSDLAITHLVKAASKAGKRKQDTVHVNPELPRTARVLATQISKKRRGSNPMRKVEFVPQSLACSSGKISPTLSLPSPSAIPSPSVSAFEKLSIGEDSKAMNVEEEAAVSLMCLSSGLAFA